MVFKEDEIVVFVYGFAKTDKDNLDKEELKYFKILAKDLLNIRKQEYVKLEKQGSFISLKV
ncbi:MAG: type II toxin-antitoxin system RelE/ParE family toxin [Melioribacteraceae bacterium]|nr:type II toxin-antitoxin system RelE/ParE family toxin [Melioribacteraceae bacterium]